MIDTILFDYDGTIMDTNDVVISSWQHVFRTLEGAERPPEYILSTLGEPINRTAKKFFPDMEPDDVVAVYREFHHEHFEGMIELFPGIIELLHTLHERGYKMAVVTNRLRYSTEKGLDKFGIRPLFGSIICEGDAERGKPFPEPVLLALEQLGSRKDDAILIGDSQNDIICGKNAELATVRVAWAVATDDAHEDAAAAPDYIIDEPADLIDLLDLLNTNDDRGWEQN